MVLSNLVSAWVTGKDSWSRRTEGTGRDRGARFASERSTTQKQTPPSMSPRRVLFACLIGTTIEFFDFYIYGTAAVLVFPALFAWLFARRRKERN